MKHVKKVIVLLLAFSVLICDLGGRPVKAKAGSDDEYIDWVEEEEPIEVDEDVLDSWEEEEEAWDDDDVYDEEEEDDDEGDDDEDDYYIDDTISVNMDIKERWENHYNAEVTVTNLTDETIDNWAVAFDYGDEVEQIWNAQITAHEENSYTIKCLDWNQDIPANGSVSFGITAKFAGEAGDILNEYLINDTVEINEDNYSVTYHESSAWPGYVSGEIRVENKSDLRIEDWKLEIATNLDIQQIWNASIESEYTNDDNEKVYLFKNMGYNQNIAAKQTCSFGFIAKKSPGDVKVEAQDLFSVSTAEPGEDEEDWETPEAVEGLTEDDFLEYSDYLDYLESQGGGNMLRSRAKAAKKTEAVPKKTIPRKVSAVYEVKGEKTPYRKKAFQNFCMGKVKGKNGEKYAYGVVHCGKNAVLMKMQLEEEKGKKKVANIVGKMTLKNFGHTQSLESFVYKDGEKEKEYFLLTGKTYVLTKEEKKKAQQEAKKKKKKLSQILKNFCTQVVCVEYKGGSTVSEKNCGKLVGVAYSNKKKQRFGRLNRVDIGLKGEDRIVIWKRRKEDQAVQVGTYSFGSNIKEKLVQKKKISFAKSKLLKYKTSFTMKKDTSNYILPKSMQSIDQGGDNTIYIASGKQGDSELCIAECSADKGVYRKKYTFKFRKKKKKTIKEKTYFPIQGKKEIEGMHSKGDQFQVVIADSKPVKVKVQDGKKEKKVTMKRQYICVTDK